MSVISEVLAGGAEGLLKGIGDLAKDIRIAITGKDPVKMAELESKLLEMEFIAQKAQSDINLVEAQNPNLFVSGARPFIMWVCGFALAYQFILYSLICWFVALIGSTITPPILNTEGLVTILLSLLGLGGLRTYEKMNNVTSKH